MAHAFLEGNYGSGGQVTLLLYELAVHRLGCIHLPYGLPRNDRVT
jgi:hypothetical protein